MNRTLRTAWTVVALLWIVALLNYLDRQLIVTMGRPVKAELLISDAGFGLFSSVFLWVYAFCSPVAGYIADRFGSRRVIFFSLIVWSTATLATGFAPSFTWLLTARAVMGVSEAFYIPAGVALIVQYHRGWTQSRATGLHLSGAYAGSILGGLGGWMADSFGWRFAFQLFGICGIAYALFLIFVLKDPPADVLHPSGEHELEKPRLGPTLRTLLGTRGFLLLLCANACNGAGFWTVRNWMPTFFNMELNVDLTRAGLYGTAFFNAAAFTGMLLGGTLSDRWSLRTLRARTLIPAIGFCFASPFFLGIGLMPTVVFVLTTVLIAGIAQGFLDTNLMPAVCTVVEERHRATGYGLLNCVGTLSGGLMTYVGGWLKDAQVPFSTTFQFTAGFILLAGLLLFAVKPSEANDG